MQHNPLLRLTGWHRLVVGAVVGLAVGFGLGLLPWRLDGASRGLLGWCAGALSYLVPAWWLAEAWDAERTRARARSLDQPSGLILAIMVVAIGVGAGVIAMLLQDVPQLTGRQRVGHIALGLTALALAWLVMHTIYAYHYAHRFYQGEPDPDNDDLGLKFPGRRDPDYFDFLYFSFVIGMTSQVSDVQVTSRAMRRITLVHGVLSFAFNMLVLALSINVVASSMQSPTDASGASGGAAHTSSAPSSSSSADLRSRPPA